MEESNKQVEQGRVDLSTAKVMSETFFVSASRIIIMVLKPIRAFFLGRYLGPVLYGIMNIATPYIQILTLSSNIGFSYVLMRDIPAEIHSGNRARARAIFHSAEFLVIVLSSLWYILLFIFSRPILEHWAHQPDALVPFRVYTLMIPFLAINTFYFAVFIAFQRGKQRAKIFLFYGLLSIIFPIAAVIWKRNIALVAGGFVAAELIGSVVFTVVFRSRVIPAFRKLSGYFSTGIKKLFSRGIFFFFTSLGWNLLNSLDRILIKFYLPARELGYYSISILFITVLAAFSSTLGQALIPSLTAVRGEGNENAFRKQIINTSRIGFIIIIPVVVMTYVLAEDLIMVLIPSFAPAVILVQILIFIGIFDLINHVAKASIVACDRGGWLAATYIFCAGWNVVWNIVLIPRMGLEGAAVASLSSYLILASSLHVLMTRFSGVKLKLSHLVMPLVFSAVYILLKWALPEMGHLPELLIVASGGTAIYLLLLIAGGMITSGDIARSREAIIKREETRHVRIALKALSALDVMIRKFGRR